jgi:hypothetical protein
MNHIVQNNKGKIVIEENLIRLLISAFAEHQIDYQLKNIEISQNDDHHFCFTLDYIGKIRSTFIVDINNLQSRLEKMIQTNLNIAHSIVIINIKGN